MHNTITFVTGRKGSGKTAWSTRLANYLYNSGRRVIVVDPTGSMQEPPPSHCPIIPGAPMLYNVQGLLSDDTDRRSLHIVPGQDERLAEMVFLYAYTEGNMVLVVDEIDIWLGHSAPDASLINAIRYGRHRQLSLIAISQRPANVMRDLTAQCDYLVMFQSTENRDIEYLSARIGRDNGERIRQLSQFDKIIYSAYSGGLIEGGDIEAIV